PAQVGFGAVLHLLSTPHRSFHGRLNPEPWRLTHPPGFRDWRSWAVRRARALGLDAVRIREAILAHARNAPSKTVIERGQLWDLKLAGLELGILHENDLPDVVLRDRRPKP
ncbi:MAG: hypothetical protein JSU86_17765, partial [Phycisphaerales bacterium]